MTGSRANGTVCAWELGNELGFSAGAVPGLGWERSPASEPGEPPRRSWAQEKRTGVKGARGLPQHPPLQLFSSIGGKSLLLSQFELEFRTLKFE